MKKQSWITLMVLALGVVFLVAGVYATQQAADCMTLNSKVYPKHTKALVMFSHKKHNVDYKITCTDCHHVIKDGKNVWKEGDAIEKCTACHWCDTHCPDMAITVRRLDEEEVEELEEAGTNSLEQTITVLEP